METSTETSPDTSRRPIRNGRGRSEGSKRTQFKSGHATEQELVEPDEDHVQFDRLATMRHVLTTSPKKDRSPGERACRQWLKRNPARFMEVYDRLESEAQAGALLLESLKGTSGVPAGGDMDEGSAKAMEMIERLLAGAKKAAEEFS